MKKTITLIFTFLLSGHILAQDAQTSPEGVVNAYFEAIKNNNYEMLSNFCDPEMNKEAKDICDMKGMPLEEQEMLSEMAARVIVSGETIINGDNAIVPVKFDAEDETVEKVNLVKRDGKWYLTGF